MRKIILTSVLAFLSILSVSIIYLTIYGVKTDNFNTFINNQLKEYNSALALKLNDVYFKLNLTQGSININTKDTILFAENNSVKVSNIDINLNIIKFIKKEKSIKNINIESSENSIKDVTSLINSVDYDLSRYIFYSQIKKGIIKFKLETKPDIINQNILSYNFSGSVKNAKFNLVGRDSIDDINFNFNTKNKKTVISNLNFSYQNTKLFSENIKITNEKSGSYFVKGDFENAKSLIDPNVILKLLKINNSFLSNRDILIQSKNFFSFRLNEFKKFKNVKIDSIINFEKIYFAKGFQKLIFLNKGKINSRYENNELNAKFLSNFAFSEDLKVKNENKNNILEFSLEMKNNQNISINGNIKNEETLINPKILFNFLKIDPHLISDNDVKIKTDNQFKFEVNDSKIESYLINSTLYFEKLEFRKKIQDIIYFKNIKTKITLGDKLLKLDLKSNFSFFDDKINIESEKNILNLKLNNANSKISDVEIFLQGDNNNINTKEFKKYFINQKGIIKDQIINLNSNFLINFSIDETFNIKNLTLKSDLNLDNLEINYKSNLIKKYLANYEDKIAIKNPNILFEYSNDIINLQLDGKYLLKNKEDNFFVKFKGSKNNFELYSLLNLDNCILDIPYIKYYKKNNIPSELEILINNSTKGLNLERIRFRENNNYINVKNLNISENYKIQSVDEIDVNFLKKKDVKNNFKIKKNSTSYNFIGNQIYGEDFVERILRGNDKIKFHKFFENINTSVNLNLNKVYLEKNSFLHNVVGEFDFKNNKLILASVNAILNNKKKIFLFL